MTLLKELDAVLELLSTVSEQLTKVDVSAAVRKRLGEIASISQKLKRQHSSAPKLPAKEKPQTITDPDLVALNERLAIVRDRVRGVGMQGQAGFYLYGRAGTSKTYTVRTTLENLDVPYWYQNGHITPIGLFELLEEHPDGIIVLDDVASIFKQPAAKNILLAALGNQPNGVREIKYKRHGKTVKVRFRGGIIAISNLELHGDELIAAIKSRVQSLNYNPPDEQIIALMRSIATKGYRSNGCRMTPKECGKVCEYLLKQSEKKGLRPDVRMLVDKAFPDFIFWKSGESETHWQDLINSALEDQLVELKHPLDIHVPTKKEEEASELQLLEEVVQKYESPEERLEAFEQATGKSKRTFQRRMRQLRTLRQKR